MKRGFPKKQLMAGMMFGFMMVTGTYNAVVINSESSISSADFKFVKRLDEVYGVVKPGREFASAPKWTKLKLEEAPKQIVTKNAFSAPVQVQQPAQEATTEESAPVEVAAAVQEELNLNLTEVMNPKIWQTGLNNTQFGGNLSTKDGVIEELNVSLPNGLGLSVAFSGMAGNVFEYDVDGQPQTAMMYQVDQSVYKVNLTSGPLQGTILTFTAEKTVEQLAEQEQHEIQQQQNREEVAQSIEPTMESADQPVFEQAGNNGQGENTPMNTDPNLQTPEIQNAFAADQLATEQAMNQQQNLNGDSNYGGFQPLVDPSLTAEQQAM